MVYFWIRLLYLINLLLFKEFFGISQIWTASDSNNGINWVEKSYSCYSVHFWALLGKWKEILNILFRKHDHERVAEWFLNSKKSKQSLKTHEICQDLMISYVEAMIKNWEGFAQSVTYDVYKPKYLRRRSVEKDSVRFGVKVTVESGFDFKTFCIGNTAIENIDSFMCNFSIFLDLFDNFNLLNTIIEF